MARVCRTGREAFAEAAQSAHDLAQLEALAGDLLREMGFKAYLVGCAASEKGTRLFGRWDRQYLNHFGEERFDLFDHVARKVRESWLPVPWDTNDYLEDATPERIAMHNSAVELGYERGLSVPIYGPLAKRCVLIAVYGESATAFRRWRARLSDELMLLGPHLANAYFRLAEQADAPPRLTARERECLAWSLNGKTAWEVSKIIGVSERTVNFHVQNAMSKFGASSKHLACMKAAQLGIIAA